MRRRQVKTEDLTNEQLRDREVKKLEGYKKPNPTRAVESVAILKERGFKTEGAENAVNELSALDRGKFEGADAYLQPRRDLWSAFIQKLRALVDEDDLDADNMPLDQL
jgi:hypothetical protein